MSYLMRSAYNHLSLMNRRVDIQTYLQRPNVSAKTKGKIQLVLQAREFAEKELGLSTTDNYTTYVELDGPYVTYVVRAAPVDALESYKWSFPIVGEVPYKGFSTRTEAVTEASKFDPQKYDTYVRGVTAYSTLGWFSDPILSSMMSYSDYDLVNTIIHETVHATIFIKNQADFNERLATFVGDLGAQLFFQKKEGLESNTLLEVEKINQDTLHFQKFISQQICDLEAWYKSNKDKITPEIRRERLDQITKDFDIKIHSHLKTNRFDSFSKYKLNNAQLLSYKTYMKDLTDFERAFSKLGKSFAAFMEFCKKLEKQKNPETYLKSYVSEG